MSATGRAYSAVACATEELALSLGNIRMLAGMMLEDGINHDQRRDYLQTIERNAKHLLHVTTSLGDFAQLGFGATPLTRSTLRLSEIAEQAVEALTPLAAMRLRLLVLAVNAGEPVIAGDYRKLLPALTGLLRHCLNLAAPAAQVILNLRGCEGGVRLDIDLPTVTGDDVPPASDLRALSEVSAEGPSELAVEIAAQVIELHGGTLRSLVSEQHRRFIVELPAAPNQDAAH